MAFKMKQGASPNFKDLGSASALPKKTKSLGTREDTISQQNPDGSNPTVDTLTKTNKRTGRQKTKDISKDRADRIRNRQNKKNPPAEPKAPAKKEPKPNPTMTMDKQGPVADQRKTEAKKSGPDWKTAPKSGTQERVDWYKENKLAPDSTTKLKKIYDETPVNTDAKESKADPSKAPKN